MHGSQSCSLQVLDTATGRVVRDYDGIQIAKSGPRRAHKEGSPFRDIDRLALTPDGRNLIVVSGFAMHRFSVAGSELTFEESGPDLTRPILGGRPEISPDSQYVALIFGKGNNSVSDHPEIRAYGTYIYKVTDLQIPVVALWKPGEGGLVYSPAYPTSIGFDSEAEYLYAQTSWNPLIVMDTQGTPKKYYSLGKLGASAPPPSPEGFATYAANADAEKTERFLVQSKGRKLLMLTNTALWWVELPAN